ncbi:MAG: sialidase, partial [Spartobacteria bacterium]
GISGPRVLPGTYTVRMTKNDKPYEMKLTVALDRRDKFSEADRKAQYDAAQRVKELFGDESALMDRILALRASLSKSEQAVASDVATQKAVGDFDGKVDAVRKQIVATTEGGAITGEERLREHTDQLFGAILSYEGKPADYQIARIDSLRRELDDVSKNFENLLTNELPKLNETLKAKGQPEISPPPAKMAVNDADDRIGGGPLNGSIDRDLPGTAATLPANFRLLR